MLCNGRAVVAKIFCRQIHFVGRTVSAGALSKRRCGICSSPFTHANPPPIGLRSFFNVPLQLACQTNRNQNLGSYRLKEYPINKNQLADSMNFFKSICKYQWKEDKQTSSQVIFSFPKSAPCVVCFHQYKEIPLSCTSPHFNLTNNTAPNRANQLTPDLIE